MPITDTRPVHHFDEVDLMLFGEIYECPHCGGEGTLDGEPRDDDEYSEDCHQCNGSGEIGVIIYTPEPILKQRSQPDENNC